MNCYSRFAVSVAAVGFLAMAAGSPAAYADDAAKLKELERAMTAPSGGGEAPKKIRTRAIVFDNDQTASTPAPEAPKAAKPADCGAVPADAKVTAVGFSIQFKVGSAEVAPASEKTLLEIAKMMSLSPDRCVLVEGHTDASGNADKNMALSRNRAEAVVTFIVEKAKFDNSRLVPIGKGSSDPEKNLDPRNPLNRRVVFKVVN